jgi:putative transposase
MMMSVFVSLFLAFRSCVRSRAALQCEVLALRHQLQVLARSRPQRLRLTPADRLLWVWFSRVWTEWRAALIIAKPDTVIAWHRQGFRLFWTWKSRHPVGRPTVPLEVRRLIRTMSDANPLWGAPRIHGELLKLGIDVGQASVAKYMVRRQPPSQTWCSFLRNHMDQITAADFFVVPTATWTAQQLREAFPWNTAPRFLLHDRDHAFDGATTTAMDIHDVRTAPRSPCQNAYVERFIGSIRRECLDHVIILHAAGLRRILKAYVEYYMSSRTHLALEKDAPRPRPVAPPTAGRVVAIPQVGGLHHRYERRAA